MAVVCVCVWHGGGGLTDSLEYSLGSQAWGIRAQGSQKTMSLFLQTLPRHLRVFGCQADFFRPQACIARSGAALAPHSAGTSRFWLFQTIWSLFLCTRHTLPWVAVCGTYVSYTCWKPCACTHRQTKGRNRGAKKQ